MTAEFSCAPFLREIGRGKDGSRALGREQALALMTAILEQKVSDLELGGVLLAMRMKGEAAVEIAGFLDALDASSPVIETRAPVVVIPTYNGSRHAPNLVPLLALALVDRGVPVLMHGQASDPAAQGAGSNVTRVTTRDILHALGIDPVADRADASARLAAHGMAYVPLEVASPGLARLIGLRRILGVRNVAHTLAKLLRPVSGPSLLLSAYTHPEFGAMLAELFAMRPSAALLMRGTEGEAVANARRPQRIAQWLDGVESTAVEGAAASAAQLPELPERDAAATATWIRAVMRGEAPMPAAIAAQRDAILAALACMKVAA
jgi:anthranilate phosphoribosyltransferase